MADNTTIKLQMLSMVMLTIVGEIMTSLNSFVQTVI